VQLAVYRIVQEALTNTLKHAGPARVHVHVRRESGALAVEVTDDGRGAGTQERGGHGLVGMRERVAMFGGDLVAGPGSDGGFVVRATLPVGA
jgi:signal transduction histidine kinase